MVGKKQTNNLCQISALQEGSQGKAHLLYPTFDWRFPMTSQTLKGALLKQSMGLSSLGTKQSGEGQIMNLEGKKRMFSINLYSGFLGDKMVPGVRPVESEQTLAQQTQYLSSG